MDVDFWGKLLTASIPALSGLGVIFRRRSHQTSKADCTMPVKEKNWPNSVRAKPACRVSTGQAEYLGQDRAWR